MRCQLACCLVLHASTSSDRYSSLTSTRPAAATGVSNRKEQRRPTMMRLPRVMPDSLNPAALHEQCVLW